MNVIDDIGM